MVSLEQIDKQTIRSLIYNVYASDVDMQTKYHLLKGKSLEEMVDYTWEQSISDEDKFDVRYYAIIYEGKQVGYTTLVFDKIGLLHTFGIKKQYRTEEVKDGWLKAVREIFGELPYVLTLRKMNERAIGFFKKKGFESRLETNEETNEQYYLLWQQQ